MVRFKRTWWAILGQMVRFKRTWWCIFGQMVRFKRTWWGILGQMVRFKRTWWGILGQMVRFKHTRWGILGQMVRCKHALVGHFGPVFNTIPDTFLLKPLQLCIPTSRATLALVVAQDGAPEACCPLQEPEWLGWWVCKVEGRE